jgi:tocopherol O-methyltransferase
VGGAGDADRSGGRIGVTRPRGTRDDEEALVAGHYDALDRFYREIWGDHVHHGLWVTGHESVQEATRAMVDRVLSWTNVGQGSTVIDAGCGYGGTSRILAGELGCAVTGSTLSDAQARYARELGGGPCYQVRSWLENGLASEEADAVLAIESISHMVDKPLVFAEAARVLRPGGHLVLVDWLACEAPSRLQRRALLEPIAREGRLPSLCTSRDYCDYAREAGLRVRRVEDLAPFAPWRTWGIVARRLARRMATDPAACRYLLSSANPDRAFAFSLARIPLALRTGTMRLVLIAAQRRSGHRIR